MRAGNFVAAANLQRCRVEMTTDCDAAVEDADVVMTLRLQNERMNGAYLPSVREFARLYGINAQALETGETRRDFDASRPD